MTSGVLVGSAYGQLGLDLAPLRKAQQEVKQILAQIDSQAGALAARQRPLKLIDGAGTAAAATSVKAAAKEADSALKAFERLEKQYQQQQRASRQLADSEIRAASAQRDYAKALALVDSELQKTSSDTVRYNNLLSQQSRLSRQAATQTPASPSGGLGASISALGPVAFAGAAITGAITAGQQAAQQAAAYRTASQDLQILAGSTARYSELLTAARQNQVLFGGSITENLDPLQQLIFISNRTGASLTDLNETTKLLASTNSKEGIGGAGFAIGEFLSGDLQSVRERFNLPIGELNKIKNAEVDASEKLRLLNDLILTQGNLSEVLAQRLKSPQAEVNLLNQQFERITIAGGNVINTLVGVGAAAANNGVQVGAYRLNLESVATGFEGYTNALVKNGSQIDAIRGGLIALLTGQTEQKSATDSQTDATNQGTDATKAQSNAIADTIGKQQDAALASERQAAIQKDLSAAGADVALGLYNQADASAFLVGKYPELAGVIEALISKQGRLASATDLAAALLRQQASQTRTLATVDAFAPGKIGSGDDAIAGVVAQQQAIKDLAKAQRDQDLALADAAGQLKIKRQELALLTKGTADYKDKETDVLLLEKRLKDERAKGGAASVRSAQSAIKALDSVQDKAADHYRKLQQLQDDYQQKSSRSQEDFNLKNSRGIEDYQQQRRRLLAEGKIFEANQLKADFEQSQRRSQEDFNLSQSRAGLDVQSQIRKEGESSGFGLASVRRSPLPLSRTAAVSGGNAPSAAPTALGGGSLTVQLILDGKTIAESSFADIEAMLMSQATIMLSSSPPKSASVSAVGGPRP